MWLLPYWNSLIEREIRHACEPYYLTQVPTLYSPLQKQVIQFLPAQTAHPHYTLYLSMNTSNCTIPFEHAYLTY